MTALKPITLETQEGWIAHSTSRCPVPPETIVRLQFANGSLSRETEAWKFNWSKRGWTHDVAAYQIIQEASDG